MDDLQKVITDMHALMAHDPDPEAMPVYATCLKALVSLQQKRMSAQQQAEYANQPARLAESLAGGGGPPQ